MAYTQEAKASLSDMLARVDEGMKDTPMPQRRAPPAERPLFADDGAVANELKFDSAGELMAKAMAEMYEATAKRTEEAGSAMVQRAQEFSQDCIETAKQLRARGEEVADTIKVNAELCKGASSNLVATRDLLFPVNPGPGTPS